jgi:signal transduction histidine kinase/ligand-binding sensor domain-containing protein
MLAAVALLALFPLGAAAQTPMPLAGYRVSSWIETDGLPSGAIWALAQDGAGYLWIGTDSGLARFDGERFRTWDELGGAPLPEGAVGSLTIAADGSLWVGFGRIARISRIHGHEVTTYGDADGLTDAAIAALAADRSGKVWAATSKGLLQFAGSSWRPVAGAGLNGNMIAVTASTSGTVLAASSTAVFERAAGAATFREVASASALQAIQSIAVDAHGGVWVTDTMTGLKSIGRPPINLSYVPRGRGYRLLSDGRDNLWVAMLGQGVWLVPLAGAPGAPHPSAVTDDQGLSNNAPSALLEDRDGNIWIGTAAGLNRLTPQRIANVGQIGVVTGLEVTARDTVWANGRDGLTRLFLQAGKWQQDASSVLGPSASTMHADTHGALWIATSDGVERLLGSGTRVERQRIAPTLKNVRAITSAGAGPIWIFDAEQGLYRWEDGRLTAVPLPPALERARVYFIFADRTGRLWFPLLGDQMVVAMLPGGRVRVYGAADGLHIGVCRQFFEDRQGTLWVAGSLGLNRLKDDRFDSLPRNDRLLDITGIIDDDRGDLWLGSASGILHLTTKQFDRALAGGDSGIASVIGATDGVAGTATWLGQQSAARTSDGRLWFLTAAGIITLDPLDFKTARAQPAMQIDVVTIDDRRVPPAVATTIPPSASRVQIEFSVANLRPEQQTRFRYRLDGFDTEWIDSGRAPRAIYTNLRPRAYRFLVQVQDAAGTWRGEAATWAFTVRPAFYQTTWFALLVIAMALSLGWTAWHLRVAQMQQRLAIVHGERARLSRELHDTLLQSLVGVSLQCGALAEATDSATTRTSLLAFRRQMESYVSECRQSLWDLRSPIHETRGLPESLRTVVERARSTTAMTLDMQVVGTPHPCPGRIDQQLLRIGQEAVTNAIRHSGGRQVCVRLEYGAGVVTLAVTDDGHGFDADDPGYEAHGHWGLVGMRERAASAGGTLSLTSSTTGTSVVITCRIPGNERRWNRN